MEDFNSVKLVQRERVYMYVLVEKVQSTAFPSIAWLKNDQSRHILANEKLLACVLNATEKWIYRLRARQMID